MKEVRYEGFEQEGGLLDLTRQATVQLDKTLGLFANLARVVWEMTRDERGRPLVVVEVRVWDDSAQTQFAPEELQNPTLVHKRLHLLWENFLRESSHRRLQKLLSTEQERDA